MKKVVIVNMGSALGKTSLALVAAVAAMNTLRVKSTPKLNYRDLEYKHKKRRR